MTLFVRWLDMKALHDRVDEVEERVHGKLLDRKNWLYYKICLIFSNMIFRHFKYHSWILLFDLEKMFYAMIFMKTKPYSRMPNFLISRNNLILKYIGKAGTYKYVV